MLNYELNYKIIGKGKEILFLPGWNDNIDHFENIAQRLNNYKFILVDLPNQGKSQKINQKINMDDYIEIIHGFLINNNFDPKIIIGHSFGGKLAFIYALKYPVDKLVLIAPSLIKNKSLITQLKIKKYKLLKFLNKNFKLKLNLNKYGSKEFLMQDGIEKINFIIATNNYYNKELHKLKIPTLLYYGKKDYVTPIKEAKYILKKIENSKLIINEEGDHFAIYNYPYHFIRVLKEFLNA